MLGWSRVGRRLVISVRRLASGPRRRLRTSRLEFPTNSPAGSLPCFGPNKARFAPLSSSTVRICRGCNTPKIKMFVSNWYIDEFGNKARVVKAYDKLK